MKLAECNDNFRPNMGILEIKGQKVHDIALTQGRIFALTEKGDVYIWKITYSVPKGSDPKADIFQHDTNDLDVHVDTTPVQIKELKNIQQIASGTDHFIALDQDGVVWAMGDDTFGQ
mmetsp:Transcript_19874/g.23036  ORF Transcript_19874/g.23036 Transcript_19874/m.23036 type:complete len:117 (+) Transcript_19874:108-458(+)